MEAQHRSPEQAIGQLRSNHLGARTHLTYPERDVLGLLGGTDPFSVFGPHAYIVSILFVNEWGLQGDDGALL